jgi:LytR cell envelope-related transcriptional attenuator
LVIANGDGRFRLASTTADRIRPLGYIMNLGDSLNPVDETVLYYRPGFDDEAAFAAIDLGVPDAIIIAFPANASQPVTDSDDFGDVIIVLGPDAPR